MNRFILTAEEKASLELQHLQFKKKKDSDRLKAVLLRSEGWTVHKFLKHCRFIKPPLFAILMNSMKVSLKMKVAVLKANLMTLKLKN